MGAGRKRGGLKLYFSNLTVVAKIFLAASIVDFCFPHLCTFKYSRSLKEKVFFPLEEVHYHGVNGSPLF